MANNSVTDSVARCNSSRPEVESIDMLLVMAQNGRKMVKSAKAGSPESRLLLVHILCLCVHIVIWT